MVANTVSCVEGVYGVHETKKRLKRIQNDLLYIDTAYSFFFLEQQKDKVRHDALTCGILLKLLLNSRDGFKMV